MTKPLSSTQGFTLVEILVAFVILFFAIVTVAAVINSANLATIQSNKRLALLADVPAIKDQIVLHIQTSDGKTSLSGEGRSPHTSYYWQAEITQSSQSPNIADEESGGVQMGANTFFKWQVEMVVGADKLQRNYRFTVSQWKNNAL